MTVSINIAKIVCYRNSIALYLLHTVIVLTVLFNLNLWGEHFLFSWTQKGNLFPDADNLRNFSNYFWTKYNYQ